VEDADAAAPVLERLADEPLADCGTTGVMVRPVVFLHWSPDRRVAEDENVMSAQLYSEEPEAPGVTTWMLAFIPSTMLRPAGSGSLGMQIVPLPVSLKNWGVREMLKLVVTLEPRPRLTTTN
jgi:hypothetical protein